MRYVTAAAASLLLLAAAATAAAQTGVAYVNRERVDAALAKGGVLVERPQVAIAGVHRDAPGALKTQTGTTVLYIVRGKGTFAAGTRTQPFGEGDVLVIPAGVAQSVTSADAPIDYLQIVVPVLVKDASAGFVYVDHDRVAAAMKKAGPLADAPNLRVSGGFRPANSIEKSPVAELHGHEADLFYVVSGRAAQVLGGRVIDGKPTGPGQIRGPKTEGGQTYQLGAGDIMWVPAATPHWFPEIPEALGYLLVKVFY